MNSRGFVPAFCCCLALSAGVVAQVDPDSAATRSSAVALPAPLGASQSEQAEPKAPSTTAESELPSELDYVPGQPVPTGYVLRSRARRGLVISGSIVFGTGYGLSVLGALPSERDKDIDRGWLFLPVLGPLVALATQRDTCDYAGSDAHCEKARSTVLVLTTLFSMQAVGAGLFTWGIMDKRRVLERQTEHAISIGPTRIGRHGYGLAASGEF